MPKGVTGLSERNRRLLDALDRRSKRSESIIVILCFCLLLVYATTLSFYSGAQQTLACIDKYILPIQTAFLSGNDNSSKPTETDMRQEFDSELLNPNTLTEYLNANTRPVPVLPFLSIMIPGPLVTSVMLVALSAILALLALFISMEAELLSTLLLPVLNGNKEVSDTDVATFEHKEPNKELYADELCELKDVVQATLSFFLSKNKVTHNAFFLVFVFAIGSGVLMLVADNARDIYLRKSSFTDTTVIENMDRTHAWIDRYVSDKATESNMNEVTTRRLETLGDDLEHYSKAFQRLFWLSVVMVISIATILWRLWHIQSRVVLTMVKFETYATKEREV